MRISKRPSGFWHLEAFGWKVSVKIVRSCWGYRRPIPGVVSWGLPFATGTIIRMRGR